MRSSREPERSGQASPTWRVPECPFPIEWSAAVMEEIRAAAMEALFSVPHGGAEIGGVLWGTRSGGRVRILAARPLECEHALGPTFALSAKDHARLAESLADGREGWEPVGWYHSHTRSEIFLSAKDMEIYDRYFPDSWHVALVVRPHGMQPMRAGFFFREANGSVHAASTYSEFLLQPVGQVGQAVSPAIASGVGQVGQAVSPAVRPTPPKHSRAWLWWAAIILGIAAGLFVFKSGILKKDWTRAFAADPSSSFALMAYDLNGQLQIHWDWTAVPIRSAEAGTLEIMDGTARTVVALDKRRLRGGTISYVRTGARVDVRLSLRQPDGKVSEEFTSFLGQAGQPDTSQASLRRDLQDQAARTRELERAVADLRWILRRDRERHPQATPR